MSPESPNISPQSVLVVRFAAIFDMVGLIASIITIAEVVIKSVEYTRRLYQAHEEFKAM
jgi:hypothetical protein